MSEPLLCAFCDKEITTETGQVRVVRADALGNKKEDVAHPPCFLKRRRISPEAEAARNAIIREVCQGAFGKPTMPAWYRYGRPWETEKEKP